jgi:hypothetical protein
MQKLLRNVFDGYQSEGDALKAYTHPDHPARKILTGETLPTFRKDWSAIQKELYSHDVSWHLGQPKYLLGMQMAAIQFPAAKWIFLADSDTLVFAERLATSLRMPGWEPSRPIAFGNMFGVHAEGLPKFTTFLGGAGVLMNGAAVAKVNWTWCINQQQEDLAWSTAPADWRVALCLRLHKIKKVNQKYMYQSNELLQSTVGQPGWSGHYENVMSNCPLTLHYQSPTHMAELFAARDAVDHGGVCVPALSWAKFTEKCDCYSRAEASNLSLSKQTSRDVLPGGVCPSRIELIERSFAVAIDLLERQPPVDVNQAAVRKIVEDSIHVVLFSARRIIQDTIAAIMYEREKDTRDNGGGGGLRAVKFKATVLQALADRTRYKQKVPFCGRHG